MEKIKGQNFRVTYGGKYIAFSTSCALHISLNVAPRVGAWIETLIHLLKC